MEHNSDDVTDSDDHVNIDTSEFKTLVTELEGIKGNLKSIDAKHAGIVQAIHEGDKATRDYVDTQIKGIDNRINNAISEIVGRSVRDAIQPMVIQLTELTGIAKHNREEINDSKADIMALRRGQKQTTDIITEEIQTRIIDEKRLEAMMTNMHFAFFGDGKTSNGAFGKVDTLIADVKEIKQTVDNHDSIYKFVKSINWTFVLKGVSVIAPTAGVLLKVFNLV